MEGLGSVVMRAAHIAQGQRVYVLAGFAPEEQFQAADRLIAAAIETFSGMSAAEAEGIRPNRVDLYVARQGDTWAGIAERAGAGIVTASRLAVMNGYTSGQQPRAGDRLKIVVPG